MGKDDRNRKNFKNKKYKKNKVYENFIKMLYGFQSLNT